MNYTNVAKTNKDVHIPLWATSLSYTNLPLNPLSTRGLCLSVKVTHEAIKSQKNIFQPNQWS